MFRNFLSSVAKWFTAASVLALMALPAYADGPSIIRIEEDWEMVIGEPSPSSDAPQVTCAISPLPNLDWLSATFLVNSHEVPNFTAGGLQLQAWRGEQLLDSRHAPNQAVLATPGEVVRWTQVMEKAPDGVKFQIINGTSTTWGNFGDDDALKLNIPTSLPNLNGYNPEVSVKNSGVSYAGNRVRSLVLKKVRAYTAEGLLAEDDNPKTAHEAND